MGSPVNRINIMAYKANESLLLSTPRRLSDLGPYLESWYRFSIFNLSLSGSSLWFHLNQWWRHVMYLVTGKQGKGFEERLDDMMKQVMFEQFGVVVDPNAFDA